MGKLELKPIPKDVAMDELIDTLNINFKKIEETINTGLYQVSQKIDVVEKRLNLRMDGLETRMDALLNHFNITPPKKDLLNDSIKD